MRVYAAGLWQSLCAGRVCGRLCLPVCGVCACASTSVSIALIPYIRRTCPAFRAVMYSDISSSDRTVPCLPPMPPALAQPWQQRRCCGPAVSDGCAQSCGRCGRGEPDCRRRVGCADRPRGMQCISTIALGPPHCAPTASTSSTNLPLWLFQIDASGPLFRPIRLFFRTGPARPGLAPAPRLRLRPIPGANPPWAGLRF